MSAGEVQGPAGAAADAAGGPVSSNRFASIDDYIVRVEGAVSAELCARILAEYGPTQEWKLSKISSGQIDRAVRSADTIVLTEREVIGRNARVRQKIDDALFAACGEVVRKYNQRFPWCRVRRDSGFALLRYAVGGFYREHADSDDTVARELACSFLLNDDFEGGEFVFFEGRKTVPMRRGDAIVFPASFMYPHQILPVTSGTRYAVVTWFL
jgi:prolyl 4-hydroxylase